MKVCGGVLFYLMTQFWSLQFVYAQSTNNYAVIRNTTESLVDMSVGTVDLIGANADNVASSVVNIGFDFIFLGKIYSQFSVSSNGLLRLGTIQISSSSNNLFGIGNTPFIAPFWDDLATGATGKVHYKIEGVAPNRKLIVEWKNMKLNVSATDESSVFQCKLAESTGIIEFVYGNMLIGAGSGTVSASIGFCYSNVNNSVLSVTNFSAPTYTTALALVSNTLVNSAAAGNIVGLHSASDGTRVGLQFVPPQILPNSPSNLSFVGVNMFGMQLNWVDNATNEVGFAIYRSVDQVTYAVEAVVPSNTTSYIFQNAIPSTTYYWKVFALREGTLSSSSINSSETTLATAGLCVSNGSGNWSSPTTWQGGQIPTQGDSVVIRNGDNVVINCNADCYSLTIGQGSSGLLEFEQVSSRKLVVQKNILVNDGATFRSNIAGGSIYHSLHSYGSIINHGTLDFSTKNNTAGVAVRFYGAENASITGNGPITDIFSILIAKGANYSSVFEISPTNFTVKGTNNSPSYGFLQLADGTLKLGGSFIFSGRLYGGAFGISSGTGIHLSNPNITISTGVGSLFNSGKLKIDAGTLMVGTTSAHYYLANTNSEFTLNGGIVNVSGSFNMSTLATTYYTQTGGTLIVATSPYNSASLGTFHISTNVIFTLSGGEIILRNPNTNVVPTAAYNYINLANNPTITGGIVQFGDGLTTGTSDFRFNAGYFPNLLIDNASGNHTVRLAQLAGISPEVYLDATLENNTILDVGDTYVGNFTFRGNVVINSGAQFLQGDAVVTLMGNFTNNGIYEVVQGSFVLAGNTPQTISGSSECQFYNLINTKNSSDIILNASCKVLNELLMSGQNANLNLNSYSIDLQSTGFLSDESNIDRIYGAAGSVFADRIISNVSDLNVAGLGLYFTTPADLGITRITRQHNDLTNGMFTSILRNYQVDPSIGNLENIQLKIGYFDGELNGLQNEEDFLKVWQSENAGVDWMDLSTLMNGLSNSAEFDGLSTTVYFTLGTTISVPLGIELLGFEAEKEMDRVGLSWHKLNGIDVYELESSFDGIHFHPVTILDAKDINNEVLSYYDKNYVNGVNYYKLRWTEDEGEEIESKVLSVDMTKNGSKAVARINLLGQAVATDFVGWVIEIFEDNSTKISYQSNF